MTDISFSVLKKAKQMAQRKRTIAKLILKGISIYGIFLGLSFFFLAFFFLFPIPRDNLAILCGLLILSGALFALGTYLIYTSYLMFRWRGRKFRTIKIISVLFGFMAFAFVDSLFGGLETAFVGEKGFVGDIIFFAFGLPALLSAVLVYSICSKLLNRLAEVAYGEK